MKFTKSMIFFMKAGEYRYRTKRAFVALREARAKATSPNDGNLIGARDWASEMLWRYRTYKREALRIAREKREGLDTEIARLEKEKEEAYHKGHKDGYDACFARLMF